jgi:hypothetical protein
MNANNTAAENAAGRDILNRRRAKSADIAHKGYVAR